MNCSTEIVPLGVSARVTPRHFDILNPVIKFRIVKSTNRRACLITIIIIIIIIIYYFSVT